ncbi:MAG: (Fe-S)-binding protein [Anaerolineales bacterium]|nr:(Fe-S)-binding protein [Anaerolineales bacterium]
MQTSVQLFITCLIDTLQPQIGEAVVTVLERAGVRVEFTPEQTCCGQPAFNAGLWDQARPIAEHTIRVFECAPGPIVIPSGSCTAMLRHGYAEIFAGDSHWSQRAADLAARCYEFSEFLVDVLGVTDLGASYPGQLTYHASCHLLRGIQVEQQPRLLLSQVRGADIVELPESEVCCGFGGVFSVEHPEISAAMLNRKINNIASTQVPTVVVADTGCLLHIQGGLKRQGKGQRVVHLAEILAGLD